MTLSATVVFGLTLVAFVLLHIVAWKLAEKLGRRTKIIVGLAALVLCLPGAWFAFYYLHFLPEPPLLYQLRALPMSEGFLAAFGIPAGIWRSLLPKALKPLPTAATIFVLTIPFLKPVFRPLDRSTLTEHWENDACIQSSVVTCGPASAASILRYLGDVDVRESDLARDAWTSQSGTEAWHLARAVEKRGFKVRFMAPQGLPEPEDLPGIIGTGAKTAGHFIAVLKIENGEIVYVDPMRGKAVDKLDYFLKWHPLEPFFMSIQRP
jgi:hypothetical protein